MAVDGMSQSELVDALYTEMAEYGFLTKYIFADGIEEIDINSWRDIEIQYSDGRTVKLEEHFDSPDHAANVIRRMLQNSGKVLDNASPIITSRLAKNIRVSVIKTPGAGRGCRRRGLHPNRQPQESDQGGLCGQRHRHGGNAGFLVRLPALRRLHLCGRRHQLRQDHCGGLAPVPPFPTASGSSPSRTAPVSFSSSGSRTAGWSTPSSTPRPATARTSGSASTRSRCWTSPFALIPTSSPWVRCAARRPMPPRRPPAWAWPFSPPSTPAPARAPIAAWYPCASGPWTPPTIRSWAMSLRHIPLWSTAAQLENKERPHHQHLRM